MSDQTANLPEHVVSTGYIQFEVSRVDRQNITLEALDERGDPFPVEWLGMRSAKSITVPRTGKLWAAQPGDRFSLTPVPESGVEVAA